MQEGIKFSLADLRHYLLVDFARGKPFAPKWTGKISNKHEMDFQGHPTMDHHFADHCDETTYDLVIPYARIESIYDSMYRAAPETNQDERMRFLHDTWTWWSFERNRSGVTFEKFGERHRVDEATVRRGLKAILRHIERELTSPVVPMVFPRTYLLRAEQA